jgi:hypothetical protein
MLRQAAWSVTLESGSVGQWNGEHVRDDGVFGGGTERPIGLGAVAAHLLPAVALILLRTSPGPGRGPGRAEHRARARPLR